MYKKLYLLITFVLVLSLAPISFGQGPIYLDLDRHDIVNTEPGFTSFLISDSGTTVNGITVYIGGDVDSRWRDAPIGVPYELIYRDFIFASSGSSITFTLLGLGANRECEIIIYSFDAYSSGTRIADWTANGAYLLTTSFDNTVPPVDANSYAFTGTAYADGLGTIVLESSQNPSSVPGQPFAFVNALVVVPKGPYVPIDYAHDPHPLDGQQNVPIDVVLSWEPGESVVEHDVYLGTDQNSVQNADRGNPLGVLVSQGQDVNSYDHTGLLKLNTTHYWRIDEVNDPNFWKGGIWSFTTLPYFVMEDFDSYTTSDDLRDVWKDNSTNGTGAFVSLESGIVRSGNSMIYEYRNNIRPHFSQASASFADLGILDPDWLGTGAQALVLYFRGDPNNPVDEPMYVNLTDGDSSPHTASVTYHSMTDIKVPQWQKWNIPLTEFNDVNLANVAGITIGFGDGSSSGHGTVYFEDIMLDIEAEQSTTAVGDVNFGTVYQQLEGFGGAAVYDVGYLPYHPKKEEIYDLLFKDLGLEILRIRNTYGYSTYPSNEELIATAEVIAAAREPQRSPNIKTELVPWSPPAYLKSNGSESGGGTLAKDGLGNFRYDDYAQWWYDSLLEWAVHGVEPDFISIQNEPIIETSYDSCRFFPNEWWSPDVAAYNIAFETVWQKLNAEMGPDMPKMWAPESMGLWDMSFYVDSFIDMNHVDGFAHHLYTEGDYDDPDGMIDALIAADANYGFKPLHMTEYVKLNTIPNFDMGVKWAWHIYNCLYYLHSTSFFNWTLFRGPTSLGGIVTYTYDDYIIRPQYWFLKGYTRFTDRDWSLLGTSVDGPGADNIRMSAFTSPDNAQLTIVILNKSKDRTVITLPDYTPTNSVVYRSGQTLQWAYLGSYTPTMSLPPESITTIWMDRRPTANAGPDQIVSTLFDNTAEVTLDGSDSNDPLGNELTYLWTWSIDGNTYEANGVSPTIELPLGMHTIELIVNNGLLDSEPDYVDVNVVTPLKAQLCLTPRSLNRKRHFPNIMAMMELPRGIKKSDVSDELFILYLPDGNSIEAVWQYIYGCSTRGCRNWYSCCWPWWRPKVKAVALFNTEALLAAVPEDGTVELQVVGRLNSGQYFVGSASIYIFTPPPPRPWPTPRPTPPLPTPPRPPCRR
jgi:glucuronoarabinoxylan endo-1,4-beta-xylanase